MQSPLPPNALLRWSLVRRIVRELRPASILEIGCGQGRFGARLAASTAYVGLEPDTVSYLAAKERVEPAGGRVLNVGYDDFDKQAMFDLVCAFEVLEHLEDDRGALRSWRTSVAPGGHLLLSTPAWQDRYNQWDGLVGHHRRYDPEVMVDALHEAGYSDAGVKLYGWPLGYALEGVRSILAGRRNGDRSTQALSPEDRTARSGRLLQPRAVAGFAGMLASEPFALLQRLRPQSGTGIIALASA